jgi:catechol 2,3-dioxygenase-like lactoylglutathione lyase family enzyme
MPADRPEIGARLDHLCFSSPDPERLAAFFACAFGVTVEAMPNGDRRCRAPARELLVTRGKPNALAFSAYAFDDDEAFHRYREKLTTRSIPLGPGLSPHFDAAAFSVADPDGNVLVFGVRRLEPVAQNQALPARLQHVGFRTPNLDTVAEFYERVLGFIASDRVHDDAGLLHACFLRSDPEHHTVALFRSPQARLDHHCYETPAWDSIRDWADQLAAQRIPIFWGVGRHGPGNNLFFMVKDPDDNLVELSAELEICAGNRPTALWEHEERTLNLWGNAVMRS